MSSSLMRQFAATEQLRDEVIACLENLSPPLRILKSGDNWSPLQIAEHLMLSYETVGSLRWSAAQIAAAPRPPCAHPVLLRLVTWAIARNVRLPLPSRDVEPAGVLLWPEVRDRWNTANDAMRSAISSPSAEEKTQRPFVHPVVGALSAGEMLELNRVHNAYHLRQLKALVQQQSSN